MAVAVLCAVVGAGCGSRVGRDRLERTLGATELGPTATGPAPGSAAAPGAGGAGDGSAPAVDPASGSGPAGPPGGGAGMGSGAAVGPSAGTPGRPTGGAGGGGTPGDSNAGRPGGGSVTGPVPGPGAGSAGPGSKGSVPPAPAPGSGAGATPGGEIRLGSFGVQSGVLGATMAPFFQGARAWVADVTARGGLNGHPVRLILGDDGGDPAETQALVRRMVEQDKVQAFYTVAAPTTLQAATPYLEQVRVPIIGMCECNPAVDESPMAFQPGIGSTTGLAWAHLAPLVGMSDKRKLSIFFCREVTSCSQSAEGIKRLAPQVGVTVVHETQMSLAQPDYTAEVLSARNAGADAVIVVADNATIVRILRSAHRQNYRPQVSTPTAATNRGSSGRRRGRRWDRGGVDAPSCGRRRPG